jgi:SAM-dependent MidA family methyltransferase
MSKAMSLTTPPVASLSERLTQEILSAISQAGGWISFDTFMSMALYTPGLGYYANDSLKFGPLPYVMRDGLQVPGSDFVTAPEISSLFGQTLARQIAQALQVTQTREIWEFGAGSGALALQLIPTLEGLGQPLERYTIVDLSGTLRERQHERLQAFAHKVRWVSELPDVMQGVVVGNEVLDAMPVKLLQRSQGLWYERGVSVRGRPAPVSGDAVSAAPGDAFEWADRPTELRPPVPLAGTHDYLTEIHPHAEAFISSLAERLKRSDKGSAMFFLDYGFPEREYYHPQRHMGTVMCHFRHQSDADPLSKVGLKDITAHVNFTGLALAAQDAGLGVLGYTSQARFLMNAGLLALMEAAALPERVHAQKLIMEHEMGELFKVLGLCTGEPWAAMGFSAGDRTHTL